MINYCSQGQRVHCLYLVVSCSHRPVQARGVGWGVGLASCIAIESPGAWVHGGTVGSASPGTFSFAYPHRLHPLHVHARMYGEDNQRTLYTSTKYTVMRILNSCS